MSGAAATAIRLPAVAVAVVTLAVFVGLAVGAGPAPAIVLTMVVVVFMAGGYLVWHLEPAHLVCAGFATSCFSGYWGVLGFPEAIAPDRMLLTAAVVTTALRAPQIRDRPAFRLQASHIALLLVGLYILCSAVWFGTASNSSALFRLSDRLGLIPFAMFALSPLVFRSPRERMVLLTTMVAVGGYLAATALLEALDLHGLVFPRYISDPSLGIHADRARGPFLEAEAMGLALFMTGAAAAVALRLWTGRGARLAAKVVLAGCALGILLTLSRAVWVGAVVAVFLTLVSFRELRRLVLPGIVAIVAGAALAIAVVPGLQERVTERTGSESRSSVWDRQNLNNAALRAVAAHPLFGVGWERWQDSAEPYFRASPDYPLKGSIDARIQAVHNAFLSNAAELGLVGCGLWLMALALVMVGAMRTIGGAEIEAWRVGFVAIALMWLVVMLFTPLQKPFTTLTVFLWAGVLSGVGPPRAPAGSGLGLQRHLQHLKVLPRK